MTYKKFVLVFLYFFVLVSSIQPILALAANSSNYSVAVFGTGMATANPSSTNYESESLSTAGSGTRNAESDDYRINIGFFENTDYYRSVAINSYSISPSSAVIGSTIGLYISATNSQSVWAKITSPNNQEQIVNLINSQTVTYLPSAYVLGRYTVTFYANSSTGAIASVIGYFELTAQTTTPVQPPSGGSGGTTTIIEKCTYFWDCTPWSLCSEKKQTRTCKNTGTCKENASKPAEEMPCSASLFDISLKLNIIELTENRSLKFRADLIEKMGAEKIDVHIKYSIINKEGYEIFSQIETRAIQEILSYEKEIEEIKLVDGEYILRVEIFYGYQQRAFAEQRFKVKDNELEIEETLLKIQKTNKTILVIIGVLISIILYLSIKIDRISRKVNKIAKHKGKKHLYVILIIFLIIYILAIEKKNISGHVISEQLSSNWISLLAIAVISCLILLMIWFKKRIPEIIAKTARFINHPRKNKDYPANTILNLIGKKVYTDSGIFIGKVRDVDLGHNKIASLKIKFEKNKGFAAKGASIDYRYVKNVGNVVILNGSVSEFLMK